MALKPHGAFTAGSLVRREVPGQPTRPLDMQAVNPNQREAYIRLGRHALKWPPLGLALAKDGLLDMVAAKAEDIAASVSRRSVSLSRGGRPTEVSWSYV